MEKFYNEEVWISVSMEGWGQVLGGSKSILRIAITGRGILRHFTAFIPIGERDKYGSNSLQQFHMVTSALRKIRQSDMIECDQSSLPSPECTALAFWQEQPPFLSVYSLQCTEWYFRLRPRLCLNEIQTVCPALDQNSDKEKNSQNLTCLWLISTNQSSTVNAVTENSSIQTEGESPNPPFPGPKRKKAEQRRWLLMDSKRHLNKCQV